MDTCYTFFSNASFKIPNAAVEYIFVYILNVCYSLNSSLCFDDEHVEMLLHNYT